MLATILNNTVFYLRTGHGISARTYCSNTIRRILGSGQDSGASPCIWTTILDTILWSVAQKQMCFYLESPSGLEVYKVGDEYIDNTALMYVACTDRDRKQDDTEAVRTQIESIAQDFKRKLFSTGGELALHKCY